LPRGPIHADLFRDNVLFDSIDGHPELTGFFDFYFAGVDTWVFDIAVCLNDWCINLDSGAHQAELADSFMRAYITVRPLTGAERELLPAMLRAGALRFWISRLWDFHLPREASLLKAHDPGHFERVLAPACLAAATLEHHGSVAAMQLNVLPARAGTGWVKQGMRTFFRQPLALAGLVFHVHGGDDHRQPTALDWNPAGDGADAGGHTGIDGGHS
jgi:hypothetical protein